MKNTLYLYIQILFIQLKIEDIIQTKAMLSDSKRAIINILYTESWISERIAATLKPYDISIQQFNVLRILKGQNGKPAQLSTIQNRMVSKMSNTTRLVDKLIKKNYVHRITCPSNRRKVEITITKSGQAFLEEVNIIIEQFETNITTSLTNEELVLLNDLLNKLRQNK